jgi:hypothetical protein
MGLALLCTSCGDAATTPTSMSASVVSINLGGALSFGNVVIGTPATGTFTIANTGTAPLNVSSIAYSSSDLAPAFSFSGGVIAPGATQIVTVQITPANLQTYNGVVIVNSNATNSVNAVPLTAVGIPAALWTQSGVGSSTFNMPTYIGKLHVGAVSITAFSDGFQVYIGAGNNAQLLANGSVGLHFGNTTFNGTFTVTDTTGLVQVVTTSSVSWTLNEAR